MERAALPKKSVGMGGENDGSSPKRIPLKTLNLHKLDKSTHHLDCKQKLRESCYKRVRENRARLLWKMRSNSDQAFTEKEFVKNAFQNIVYDELKKIKSVSSGGDNTQTGTDDMLWEYDGLHTAYEGECEDILLEMQRIFYEDLKTEPKGRENSEVWEDEEDEYLARAVLENMQLSDEKIDLDCDMREARIIQSSPALDRKAIRFMLVAQEEKIWCPVCKQGEVKEISKMICCNLCQFQLKRGDRLIWHCYGLGWQKLMKNILSEDADQSPSSALTQYLI